MNGRTETDYIPNQVLHRQTQFWGDRGFNEYESNYNFKRGPRLIYSVVKWGRSEPDREYIVFHNWMINISLEISRVSCQKDPTRQGYAW